MDTPISLQTLIESIEALSLEDQSLLFEQLYRRRLEKQCQENTKKTADITEALSIENTPTTSKSNQPQNPLLMVPATLKNNPLFDEVLGCGVPASGIRLPGNREKPKPVLGS